MPYFQWEFQAHVFWLKENILGLVKLFEVGGHQYIIYYKSPDSKKTILRSSKGSWWWWGVEIL